MSDECSETTLRINGLARQMRRWKMSDLIKTLRGMDEYWQPTLYNQAADALEAKEAQIERLKAALRKICSTEKRLTNHGYEIARQALEDDE